jgi:hypothetical protein
MRSLGEPAKSKKGVGGLGGEFTRPQFGARVHRRGGVVVQVDGLVRERHGGKMGRNGVRG